ncbi:MAG: polysaccharide biosynthesis C-terminal domain-containing protein, partial [Pseudolabrys sp.]
VMTGPLLVNIFLGPEFRPLTLSLLPILVSATFLKVLLYYVIYGYALAARTNLTLLAMATAAACDVVLNVILIPRYGAWGAAIAALVGFGAGLASAIVMMRRVFPFPAPEPAIVGAGLVGAAAMAAFLAPLYHVTAPGAALYIIPGAVLIYFGATFLFLHLAGRNPLDLLRGLWNEERRIAGL